MEESQVFELPKASEKLSYKFILDALLKERLINDTKTPKEDPPAEETLNLGTGSDEASCGTAAAEVPNAAPHTWNDDVLEELQEEQAQGVAFSPELPEGKKYFRIGEVSELLKVEAYVVRYWESEFKSIRPVKSGSGHRVYSRKDVELLLQIRHLLYTEKFSIKGAKKRLMERKKEPIPALALKESQRNHEMLKSIMVSLKDLMTLARNANPGVM